MASRVGFQQLGPDVLAAANAAVTYRVNNQEHLTLILNCTAYTASTIVRVDYSVDGINYFQAQSYTITAVSTISTVNTPYLNSTIALHSVRVTFVSGTASITVTGAVR